MGDMVFDEFAASIDALTVMHQLVARLYKHPPDDNVLAYFRNTDVNDRDDLFLSDEVCAEGIGLMCRFCRAVEMEEAIRTATGDHSQLFVGPVHLPSPPWSSVYMDRGSLFGPTALAVENEFKRFGFWIPEGDHEPCDHIAYELQFIAELHKLASENLRQMNQAGCMEYAKEARQFIGAYLAPWLGKFLALVEEHAETDFYRGLGKLTGGLIELESEFLDEILNQEADGVLKQEQ